MAKALKDGKWVLCRKCGSTLVFTPRYVVATCPYCAVVFDPMPRGTLLVMGPAEWPLGEPDARQE